jgi:hypothetical protein
MLESPVYLYPGLEKMWPGARSRMDNSRYGLLPAKTPYLWEGAESILKSMSASVIQGRPRYKSFFFSNMPYEGGPVPRASASNVMRRPGIIGGFELLPRLQIYHERSRMYFLGNTGIKIRIKKGDDKEGFQMQRNEN